jgi:cell division protein FtsW
MKLLKNWIYFVNNWWRSVDQSLIFCILALLAFSSVLVTTAGPAVAAKIGLVESYFIQKHMIFVFMSLILVFSISLLDKKKMIIFGIALLLLDIILLILTKFYGYEVKGAKRWISVLGFSLQPSELIKPALIIVNAWLLAIKDDVEFSTVLVSFGIYVIIAALVITQPDLGMLITITAVWAVQLFISGMPFILILICAFLCFSLVTVAYYLLPHVAQRINGFLDPDQHENYQVGKSILAFKNGGIYGRGPGEGVVKQVLPDSHTDFIFAVAGEEFGAIICSFLICIFAFIVIRGMIHAMRNEDKFIIYSCVGLLFQIASQSIINIGVNLNLLPTKGMTLPFISSGGSSMIAVSLCFGMLVALTRRKTNLTKFRSMKFDIGVI